MSFVSKTDRQEIAELHERGDSAYAIARKIFLPVSDVSRVIEENENDTE